MSRWHVVEPDGSGYVDIPRVWDDLLNGCTEGTVEVGAGSNTPQIRSAEQGPWERARVRLDSDGLMLAGLTATKEADWFAHEPEPGENCIQL